MKGYVEMSTRNEYLYGFGVIKRYINIFWLKYLFISVYGVEFETRKVSSQP